MRKLFFWLLLAAPLYAEGPIFQHKDSIAQQEFENVYKDIRLKVASTSLDPLNISSATISSATINALITSSINGTFIGLGRNRIINGEMLLDQANGGALVTVNAATQFYSVDQFSGQGIGSAGVFTLQQLTATPPTGFTTFLRSSCTVTDSSLAASDRYRIFDDIEGYNVRDFLIGSSSAKTITLSFWVRGSLTGTYSGAFNNGATDRSYPFEYSVSSADTWEKKSITVPMDTSGTWLVTTGLGLRVVWALALGSNHQGTANTWQAGNFSGTSSQSNFMSSNSARYLDITGVQLEIGTLATDFERPPFPLLVAWCQRYYEKSYAFATAPGSNSSLEYYRLNGSQTGTTAISANLLFRIQKRVVPTMTFYRLDGTSGSWGWTSVAGVDSNRSTTTNDITTSRAEVTQTAAVEYRGFGHWVADARL